MEVSKINKHIWFCHEIPAGFYVLNINDVINERVIFIPSRPHHIVYLPYYKKSTIHNPIPIVLRYLLVALYIVYILDMTSHQGCATQVLQGF